MRTCTFLVLLIFSMFFMNACLEENKNIPLREKGPVVKADPILLFGSFLTQRGQISKWTESTLSDAFQRAEEGGFRLAIWTSDWGSTEHKLGKYDWAFLDYITSRTEQYGFKFSLSLEIVHIMDKANYPKGIKFTKFDDPVFVASFKKFVRKLFERYAGKIDYLWIGQEVDLYLHNHPEQKAPFLNFFQEVKKEIKSAAPEVKVGIVGSYHIAKEIDELKLLQVFADKSDVIALTLYPEFDNKNNPDISDMESYLEEMVSLFPGKKIAIHETAWSSKGKKGNDQAQIEYIKILSKIVKKYKERFEFVSWWILYDFSKADNVSSASEYKMGENKEFIDWQGSCGLFTNEGKEKPAWNAWKKYMSKGK